MDEQQEKALIGRLEQEPHGLTFVGALREVLTGNAQFVDKAAYLERLRTCAGCEHKIHRLNICGLCKCILPTKARFAHATCPAKKWDQSK